MSKQIPLRMFFVSLCIGGSSLYYMARHGEMNRVRNLNISAELMINIGARGALAFVIGDYFARKLFINYDRVT